MFQTIQANIKDNVMWGGMSAGLRLEYYWNKRFDNLERCIRRIMREKT